MTCPDMEARIAEFLAGELEERAAVEAHLLACADCRAAFSVARAGWEAADEWKVDGPSGDAIAATLDRLEAPAPNRAFVRALQIGTLAASLVIAFVIGSSDRLPPVAETAAPPVKEAPAMRPSTGLASLRPSVGLLYVQDENGRPAGELAIQRLEVRVDIRDGIARTEIEEIFENRTGSRLEGTFQFPLPPDASISRLAMEIDGTLMEGEVVEREKARKTYEGIVRSMKDPALLEWMPGGLFQCRIFPIEPRSEKRIVIAYTQALSLFDHRGRYVYPLSGESTRELGIGRFEVEATVRSGAKLVSSASTSHDATTTRVDERTMRTTFSHSDFRPAADFVLAFETEASSEFQVAAHRPAAANAPGYFAAYFTPRIDPEEALRTDRRLFFLLDVSGSVARAELEAARVVVRRMIRALGPSDRFRIGAHNLILGSMQETVAPDEEGKRAAERYLADLACAGASDVAVALESAVALVPDHGELVYIGEGTPTWGEKDPAKIVAKLREAAGNRRISIRTVAVGSDAEKGLLETIAREFNGGSHSISPSDDVTMRADEIARTLGRSALTDLKVRFDGDVTDVAPATLGSLHFGERLLVTGRYGSGPVKLHLSGKVRDREITREFVLRLPETEPGNLHVKRLWAQRKLADLVAMGEAKKDEAVKLSVECQVMTPYTSFLVLENEKAYEQHRIERTRKDADQSRDPKLAEARKLFQEALADYKGRKLEEVIRKCDRILAIDPNHALAAEVKDRAQKDRHRETYAEPPIDTWAKGQSADPVRQDRRRDLEKLFAEAQTRFEREQYNECIDSCDRILAIDPRLSTVEEMRMIAARLNHAKTDRELKRTYLEQWKRTFAETDLVLQRDELSFPARDSWNEAIRQRRPHGILGTEETMGKLVEPLEEEALRDGWFSKRIVEQTANGGLAFTVGEGAPAQKPALMPFLADVPQFDVLFGQRERFSDQDFFEHEVDGQVPSMLRGAPADIRVDGFYLERDFVTRKPITTEQLFFTRFDPQNRSGIDPMSNKLFNQGGLGLRYQWVGDSNVDIINRLPVGGYDIGGVGFTDLEEDSLSLIEDSLRSLKGKTNMGYSALSLQEGKHWNQNAGEGIRQLQLRLMKSEADLSIMNLRLEQAERVSKDLGTLEDQYQELARERQRLQEIIANLNARGIEVSGVAPRKALSGSVTAVAPELDLVVISIGRDAGVNEGDEFTLYRSNFFVAKMAVDRVDRSWSSGRVLLKGKESPRIGDNASNHVFGTPNQTPSQLMKVASGAGDEVHLTVLDSGPVEVGAHIVLMRQGKYVATVRIIELHQGTATCRIYRRLRACPIESGDIGVRMYPTDELWSLLPDSIRKDLRSESALGAARLKLLALRKGGAR